MGAYNNKYIIASGSGLSKYLDDIKKFPMLSLEEEYALAKAWVEEGCRSSAHKLVTSHLRLAAKIAMGYRGYGLPISEVAKKQKKKKKKKKKKEKKKKKKKKKKK